MKHCQITIITLLLFTNSLFAQSDFIVPDSVCAEELFTPTYNGTGSTFFWHFCSGNLNIAPNGITLAADNNLKGPAFMSVAKDTGGYYALISNHGSLVPPSLPGIVLYRFGDSLQNPNPQSINLGNFGGVIPEHTEGVQLKKDTDGKWYGFVVGGGGINDKLIRLDFGTSLENTPIVTDMGNLNNSMDYPVDFYLMYDQGNSLWIGFTVNYVVNSNNGYITRFNFNNGLGNPPSTTQITNIGLNHPCGIFPIHENGKWYMFVTNIGSSSITRLTFGNSLFNTPTIQNMGQVNELDSPFDIAIIKDCQQTFGMVVNRFGDDIVRLDFPSGLDSAIVYTPLGNIGNLYNPHGITDVYRVDNEIFVFVANADNNTISRLYYETCTESSVQTSTDKNPAPLYYKHEGNFNISLIVDQGLPTETAMCKNIRVNAKPKMSLPNDYNACPQSSLYLDTGDSTFTKYLWSTNATTPSIHTKPVNGNIQFG